MRFKLTLVRLVFIPILSFVLIIFLANGIRELIIPEWQGIIDQPIWATVIAWIELVGVVTLSIISIYCLVVLYYVLTKYVSVDKLEEALRALKED